MRPLSHSGVLFRVFIRIPCSYSVFPKLYVVVFLLKDGTMKKKKKRKPRKGTFQYKTDQDRVLSDHVCLIFFVPVHFLFI